ncbi:MAG: TonB-dependent receptor [Bacteroidota bacterium]
MKILVQVSTIAILLLVQFYASAQGNTGKLSGYVLDKKTEEPLIGATVRLVDTNLGAITDVNGYYMIPDIPAKTYSIEASYVGFVADVRFNIVVRSGGTPDVNFQLDEESNQLDDVVVTASPFRKSEETPLSIQRLSPEEIATFPGGNNDIAKVVQALPGVAGSVGGFRNDVIIRGGAPNENVYYLDGIEIPNINHFATQGSAGGPVGLLNVSFFEGVTLSTSSFGSQYDNVLSGVLQFDQRDGNNRAFQTNIRVSSSEAALTFEGPLFKGKNDYSNTSFIASARRSYLQLLFQALDLPFLPDYWDYQYKLTHKIDKYNELIFTGVGSIDDFSVNIPDDINEEQQANLDQVPIIKQRTNTVGASWKRRFKNGSGFMTTAISTNVLNNDFTQFEDNTSQTNILLSNVAREQETKLRYAYTRFAGDWIFTGGAVIQNADYQNETSDLVNNFQFDNGINFWRYGFNGQASRSFLNERLSFSAGFRVDGNSFTTNGNELYRTFSPRTSLSYKLDTRGNWTINGSVGRYYKIAPYTVLGFTDNNGQLANQDIDYIENDHAVLGIERILNKSTRVTVEGFYKRYRDYPVSLTDSVSLANLGADFSVLGNEPVASIGLGRTYGVEFLYQKKFTKNFYGILALTLYNSEFTGFDQDEFVSSTWDNGTLLTFTGGYKFGTNWELSARVRYLGETPTAPLDQQATLANYPALVRDFSRQGQQRLDAFNQTDIRIDKKWNLKGFTLDVFLELQNAFGQQTPQEPLFGLARNDNGDIAQPRQLQEIENIDTSQILPTLGLVIDF